MKIRNGFVSNSSSSSFVVTFEDEDHYKQVIADKDVFKKHILKQSKHCTELKDGLKQYNEHTSNKFTIEEAVDVLFNFLKDAKLNLSLEDFADEIDGGYDDSMDEIIRGKIIFWEAKEGKKHGLTRKQISLLYTNDCGLPKETVNDIQQRCWKYRHKISKELAKAKAVAILERNYYPFLIQFEIADDNGPLHGFLEHYLVKNAFKHTPIHVYQFSHH